MTKILGVFGIVAVVYVALWLGVGLAVVGQAKTCSTGVYGYDLPILLGAVVILPKILGYLEGKE